MDENKLEVGTSIFEIILWRFGYYSPSTATVESDISIINYENNSRWSALTDLSLERIVHNVLTRALFSNGITEFTENKILKSQN